MSLRLLTAAAAGNAMGKTTQGVVEPAEVKLVDVDEQTLLAHVEAVKRERWPVKGDFVVLNVGSSTGKSEWEFPKMINALRRRCPELSAEQALALILRHDGILVPDPDGDVRLDHGGCIVVMSADGLRATPEELEAAITAGRLLVDERHVVELPELAPSAEVMKSLERIARPLAEPAFPWRALELAGDADRPNRKQRRKAQKAARREQRRRR